MKILAIDSSGLTASVAIVENSLLVAEYTVNYKKTHSQTLVPMLEEIKKMTELELDTIDAIAVAAGPGSFTGLRIGSATAKGLGLALNRPVIPVSALEGLAWQMYGVEKLICPVMDARRNQVYTGLYEFKKRQEGNTCAWFLHIIKKQCAVSIEEILEECNRLGREVVFLGDGVPVHTERLAHVLKVPYFLAPAHRCRQSAGAVGVYGCVLYEQGIMETAEEHKPEYLRLSQAERERLEREHGK